ncbi:PAS domain S-box protein [candidate division KSB1 bacterium]|nr:PAS domain S-box protein [candidate division KSB1 bacterium]
MIDNENLTFQLMNELEQMRGQVLTLETKLQSISVHNDNAVCRQIFELMDIAVTAVNPHGTIQYANKSAGAILKMDRDELIGRNINHVLPTVSDGDMTGLIDAFQKSDNWSKQFQIKTPDNSFEKLIITCVPSTSEPAAIPITRSDADDRYQHMYKTLVEGTNQPIFSVSADGMFLFMNGAAAQSLGHMPEELIGKTMWDLFPKDIADRQMKNIRKVIHSAKPCTIVSQTKLQSQTRWYDVHINPIIEKDSDINSVLCILVDITEQKQIEQSIHESEHTFRSLIAAMTEGLCLHEIIYNDDGQAIDYRILDINPAYEAITGLSRLQAIGGLGSKLYGIEKAPFIDCYARVAETQISETMDIYWEPMHKHFLISIVSPKKGQFATIFTDITDIRIAEQALRESEQRYRMITSTISDWAYLLRIKDDDDFETEWISESIERATGYSATEIKKMNDLISIIHPDDIDYMLDEYKLLLKNKEKRTTEYRLRKKSGEYIWVQDNIHLILSDDGTRKVGATGASKDITDRKQAELQLKKERDLLIKITETVPVGISNVDANGEIKFANRAAEHILGLKIDKITQLNYNDPKFKITDYEGNVLPSEKLPFAQVKSSLSSVANVKHAIQWPNGDRVLLLVNASPVFDDSGKFAGMVASFEDVTRQQETAKELQESEERFRTLFDVSPLSTAHADLSGKIIKCNTQFTRLHATSGGPDQQIGRMIFEFFPDDSLEYIKRKIQNLLDGKSSGLPMEIVMKRDDGTTFYAEITGAIMRDVHGQAIGMIAHAVDISRRKEMEYIIRESEEQFRTYVESSPTPIFIVNTNAKYQFVNQAACDLLGYSANELLTMTTRDVVYPLPNGETNTVFKTLLETGRIRDELVLKHRNGSKVDVIINAVKLTSDSYIGFCEDITERKQIEQQLRNNLQFLETLVDTIPNPLFYLDRKGIIRGCNTAFASQIIGASKNELIGANVFKLSDSIAKELMNIYRNNNYELGNHTRDQRLESHIRCADGTIREFMFNKAIYTDFSGSVAGLVGILIDLTQLRQLENQLRHSQKMEAIGTLAGGVAHDFNNILTPIMGYADLIMQEFPAMSSTHDDVKHILTAAHRAKELVEQILAFSRETRPERKPLKLHLIVKEVLKLLKPTLPATIEIRTDIDSHTDTILADPSQMHQMMMNLCTNAYQAIGLDRGMLEISLHQIDVNPQSDMKFRNFQAKPYVRLTIRDTGIGIDPQTINRIFEPFFTTKEVGKGSGLGLSVVHGIVKNHNGEIMVSSEVGKGTTFHIFLPVIEKEPEQRIEHAKQVVGGSERILFVDDEEAIVKITARLLTKYGYHITSRTSSLEALKLLEMNPDAFDIIITDLTMPDMTGVEFAGQAKSIRPDIPVILISGYSEILSSEMQMQSSIDEIVIKPIVTRDLCEKIRKVLDSTTTSN